MNFIYVYYINNLPFYVGKTKRPYSRFLDHLYEDELFKNVNRIDLCTTNTYEEATYFEKYYIGYFRPSYNKRSLYEKFQNFGLIHQFESLSLDEFNKKYSKYKPTQKAKASNKITFHGRTYPSENQFIREIFKGQNVKVVRQLRSRLMKRRNCDINDAYEIILNNKDKYFNKQNDFEEIEKFIINHPEMTIKSIANVLGISVERVRSRRIDLISKGIIKLK